MFCRDISSRMSSKKNRQCSSLQVLFRLVQCPLMKDAGGLAPAFEEYK